MPTVIRNTAQTAAVLQRRFLPRVISKIIAIANVQASDTKVPVVQQPNPSGRTEGGVAAAALVVIVRVVLPPAFTGEALKAHVAPVGKPEQLAGLKVTVSLKPLTATTVSTVSPVPPAVVTVSAAGFEEITKSAAPPLPTFHSLTRL